MAIGVRPWTWGFGLALVSGGAVLTMQNCAPQEPVSRRVSSASTGGVTCELVPPSKSIFRQGETINFSGQFDGLQLDRYRAVLYRVASPRSEQIGTGKSFSAQDSFVRLTFAGFGETTAVGAKSYFVRLFDAGGMSVCDSEPVEINIDGTSGGGSTTTVALNAPTYAASGLQLTEVVVRPQASFPGLALVENPSNPNVRLTIGGAIGCPTNIRVTRESPTEVRGTFNNLMQSVSGCSLEVRYQTSSGVVVGTVASPAIPGGSSSGGATLTSLTAQVPYSARATVSAIVMGGSFPGLAMAPTIRFSPQGCPSNIAIENYSPTQVLATFSHLTSNQQCTVDMSYMVSGETRTVQGAVMIGAVAGVSISNVRQETPAATTGLSIDGNFPAVPTTGAGLVVNFASGVGVGCPTTSATFVSASTSLVRVTIPNLTANATGCRLRLSYPGVFGGEFPNVNLTAPGSQAQPSVNPNGAVLQRGRDNERHYSYMSIYGQYPDLPQATQNLKTSVTLVSGSNCPNSIETTFEKGGAGEGQINVRYVNVRREATNCRFRIQYTVGSLRSTEFTVERIPAIPSLFSSTVDASCSNATLVGHNISPAETEILFYTDNGSNWELITESGQPVSVTLQGAQYTSSLSGQSNPFYNGKEGARFPIPNAAKQKLTAADRGLRFAPVTRAGGGPLPAPHDQPAWDVGDRLLCTP